MAVTAGEVLSELNLEESKVLNIYQFGSRVYGTNNDKSDFDVAIVFDGYFPAKKNTLTYGKFDVNFFSLKEFTELMEQHKMNILENVFAPRANVLLEKVDFRAMFKLDKVKLKDTLKFTVEECITTANRLWDEGVFMKAKKKVFHAIRFTVLATQIARHGTIQNISEANGVFRDLMKARMNTREEFQKFYNPILSQAVNAFKSACE